MVLKYIQKAPRQVSSQTDNVWSSIDPRTTKSGLSEAKLLGTMVSKTEPVDHLKMTPIGSLSNFRSIGHRLTPHQSATSLSRQNQVYWRQDPKRLQNSDKRLWLVLFIAQESPHQISGHSEIVWPSFGLWRKIGSSARQSLRLPKKLKNLHPKLQGFSSSFL